MIFIYTNYITYYLLIIDKLYDIKTYNSCPLLLQEQYKMMRADNSKLKRQNAELMREVDSRSDLVRAIETDTTYYAQQCEVSSIKKFIFTTFV